VGELLEDGVLGVGVLSLGRTGAHSCACASPRVWCQGTRGVALGTCSGHSAEVSLRLAADDMTEIPCCSEVCTRVFFLPWSLLPSLLLYDVSEYPERHSYLHHPYPATRTAG